MQFFKHVKIKLNFKNIEKKKKKNVGLFISFAANVAQSCRNE